MRLLGGQLVGINIADHTVEVVALAKHKGRPKIISLARTVIIPGIVEGGKVSDEKKLARIILKLFSKAQPKPIDPKEIHFALPESQVYSHVFIIKNYSPKNDIENLVYEEALRAIPLTEDDLLFSYKVIHVAKKQATVLLTAASRQVVGDWQHFFKRYLKIDVEKFDSEILANYRGIFVKPPTKPVCLVDIGASTTSIGLFDKQGLQYVHTTQLAGDKITVRIAKTLGITKEDAEKRKIRYGLVTRDNDMYSILTRNINAIFKEMMQAVRYYHGKSGKKIHKVVLLGGSSRIKGLTEYLQTNLNLPVELADTVLVEESVPVEYVTAIGTAWHGLSKYWQKNDPLIELSWSQHAKAEHERKKKEKKDKKQAKEEMAGNKSKKTNKPTVVGASKTLDLELDIEEAEMEGADDFALDEISPENKARKTKMQLIAFLVILVIGIGGVVFAWQWRAKEKDAKELAMQEQLQDELNIIQTLEVRAMIAMREKDYSEDYISGRIVRDIILMDNSYEDAYKKSIINIQKEMVEGEVHWQKPIASSSPKDEAVFPLTFEWLVYSDKEANRSILAEVDKLNSEAVDYSLSDMKKTDIIPGHSENFYYLLAEVTIATSQPFVSAETADELGQTEDIGVDKDSTAEEVESESDQDLNNTDNEINNEETVDTGDNSANNYLIIRETGLGYLNARQGPSTDYDIVKQVDVGQEFEILEQSGEWYRIDLSGNEDGWVIDTYVELVE